MFAKYRSTLFDLFCFFSILGIWPRFIEPNLLSITKLVLPIKNLPRSLDGFTLLQFSDLHFSNEIPSFFLKKIHKKTKKLKPDLILFSGDFLSYSKLENKKKFKEFLNGFNAPYGCFAILGNHDYLSCVSINKNGEYDRIDNKKVTLSEIIERLFQKQKSTKTISQAAKEIPHHQELENLLQETPFTLLHNKTIQIPIKKSFLNLCGLGEYSLGRTDVKRGFKNYHSQYPGIVLCHNPDALPLLSQYPSSIILSGHTHGGQVNIPFLWNRLSCLENPQLKRGLVYINQRKIYINRGVGSTLRFRLFSIPEMLFLTLRSA